MLLVMRNIMGIQLKKGNNMLKKNEVIRLVCPSCNKFKVSYLLLDQEELKYICKNVDCEMEYPIISGIPCLISTTNDDFHGLLSEIRGLNGKVY